MGRKPLLSYVRQTCAALLVAAACSCGSAVDDGALLADYRSGTAAEVTVQGSVIELLPDTRGTDGPHENFDIVVSGLVVRIVHNLSLAPRVPVTVGATVVVHGQFEPDPSGPVIHYTHHATGSHEGGSIELGGRTYQ